MHLPEAQWVARWSTPALSEPLGGCGVQSLDCLMEAQCVRCPSFAWACDVMSCPVLWVVVRPI
jgi:hypothetical protein